MNNKTAKILLSAVMLLAVTVAVVLAGRYISARNELSSLKKDLAASTAEWKRINEEKIVVQKELKEVKNELREATLTITESEERAEELEKDIQALEKEIEELKTQVSPAP